MILNHPKQLKVLPVKNLQKIKLGNINIKTIQDFKFKVETEWDLKKKLIRNYKLIHDVSVTLQEECLLLKMPPTLIRGFLMKRHMQNK
jgi:hypothetical protein